LACAATDGLLLYYEEVDLLQQGAARDDGRLITVGGTVVLAKAFTHVLRFPSNATFFSAANGERCEKDTPKSGQTLLKPCPARQVGQSLRALESASAHYHGPACALRRPM
jgi:hypothetical protein